MLKHAWQGGAGPTVQRKLHIEVKHNLPSNLAFTEGKLFICHSRPHLTGLSINVQMNSHS